MEEIKIEVEILKETVRKLAVKVHEIEEIVKTYERLDMRTIGKIYYRVKYG